jgi:hypothetical protein
MGLEEIKARQRSRDRNTAYFQAVANQRSRRKLVTILEGPNGLVDTQEGMMKVARDFYKELFAKESKEDITIGEYFWDEDDFISQEENDMLTAPFTKDVSGAACGLPAPSRTTHKCTSGLKRWPASDHKFVRAFAAARITRMSNCCCCWLPCVA